MHKRQSDTIAGDLQSAADPESRVPDEPLTNQTAVGTEELTITREPQPAPAHRGLQPGQIFEQRFQLLRELGAGGMGQVWLAEQTEPVRRLVAVKLIRAGMYDTDLVYRFFLERRSIAIMEHPCIAKVFDAGRTAQGQPYFV